MSAGLSDRRDIAKKARRRRIQRAAKKIFSDRGFLGATMDDIAARSGLSVGALYLYFKSKEELYVSLLGEVFELLTRELARIVALACGARGKMTEVWELLVRLSAKHPESHQIFLFLSNQGIRGCVSSDVLLDLNRAAGKSFHLCAAILDEGVRTGAYRPHDSRGVSEIVWTLFLGTVQLHEARRSLGIATVPLEAACLEAWSTVERGLLRMDGATTAEASPAGGGRPS
ncbi:MAG: TetR/AcrR family transcriptional regulator [Myxococcota bacterium]